MAGTLLVIAAVARLSPRPITAEPQTSPGVESTVLEYVGQLGGFVSAVTAQGNYVFVATGDSVSVLDVATPDTPRLVGRSEPWLKHGPCIDLAATDHLLFATSGDRDIVVMDVAGPEVLAVVATISTDSAVDQIEAAGGRLYVASGTEVLIFDVTEPKRPLLQSATETGSYTAQLLLNGSNLFVVNVEPRGMLVLDVQNPISPRILHWIESVNVRFVAAAGDLVFTSVITRVAGSSPGLPRDVASLRVLDVSPGAGFVEIGHIDFAPQTGGGPLIATQETVYVTNGIGGSDVRVVDIRQPTAPREVGHLTIPTALAVGSANDLERAASNRMYILGTRLFVVIDDHETSRLGVMVLDLTDEHSPSVTGAWLQGGPGIVTKIEVGDGILLVGEPMASFARVYDCSDRLSPREVSTIPMNTRNVDFAVSGHRAVVLDSEQFHLIDLTDPTRPLTIAELPVPGGPAHAFAVAMSGPYIYMTMRGDGETGEDIAQLAVYEILDDDSIVSVTRLEFGPQLYMFDLQQHGDHLLIATQAPLQSDSVWVVNVSDPYQPLLVGHLDTPSRIRGQLLDGVLAYVVVELPLSEAERVRQPAPVNPGLRILDISDPTRLREIGMASASQVESGMGYNVTRWGVGASRGFALLAAGDGYVRAIDVREPSTAQEIQVLRVPGIVSAIALLDDVAYVAGDEAGLLMIRVHPHSVEQRTWKVTFPILVNHR